MLKSVSALSLLTLIVGAVRFDRWNGAQFQHILGAKSYAQTPNQLTAFKKTHGTIFSPCRIHLLALKQFSILDSVVNVFVIWNMTATKSEREEWTKKHTPIDGCAVCFFVLFHQREIARVSDQCDAQNENNSVYIRWLSKLKQAFLTSTTRARIGVVERIQ